LLLTKYRIHIVKESNSTEEYPLSPVAIASTIIILLIIIVAFLALREFFCWYWKINEKLQKLSNIEKYLALIAENQRRNDINKMNESGQD
jgi:hypothetical protein